MNKIVLRYRQTGPVEWERNMKSGLATTFSFEMSRYDENETLIGEFNGRIVITFCEGFEIRNLKDLLLLFDENDPLFRDLSFDECMMVLESFIGEVIGTAEEILRGVNLSDNRVVVTLRDQDSGRMWDTDWERYSLVQPLHDSIRKAHSFVYDYLVNHRLGCRDFSTTIPVESVRELYQELDKVVANMVLENRG